ncbi:g12061 [Coccomyxa viridis]|uniref:G12061 protein n=1 Tax=Coccomyxa viridis TaxID=1274662 RepID=A0ABP1G9S0_9CHLO
MVLLALTMLSEYDAGPQHRKNNPDSGPDTEFADRPATAGSDARSAEGLESASALPDTPTGQAAMSSQLHSAFASSSALHFSEDQGRPLLSGRRSNETEGGRSSTESRVGEPPTRISLEKLDRSVPGDKETGRPEENLHGLTLPLQGRPLKSRALSKVSEEASSLERESSGRVESSTGRPVRGIMTDSHGREGTSKVLGGVHEQEQEDRRRSSEPIEVVDPAEQQRWRGHGTPDNVKGTKLSIDPHFLQPVERSKAHTSTPGIQHDLRIPQSSAGSAPGEQGRNPRENLEPADSAWRGKGSMSNALSRFVDTGGRVLRLSASSGRLSSATSSIPEGTERGAHQAAQSPQEGRPFPAKAGTRPA